MRSKEVDSYQVVFVYQAYNIFLMIFFRNNGEYTLDNNKIIASVIYFFQEFLPLLNGIKMADATKAKNT